jgi:hypothetical protein
VSRGLYRGQIRQTRQKEEEFSIGKPDSPSEPTRQKGVRKASEPVRTSQLGLFSDGLEEPSDGLENPEASEEKPIGKPNASASDGSDGSDGTKVSSLKEKVEPPPEYVLRARSARAARAGKKGLNARWSKEEFGYISLHDPLTGEVHDVETKDAPGWAKWEAGTRKAMYKAGRRDAYDLTSAQMSQIWEEEHPVPSAQADKGIVEEHVEDLD